MKCNRGHEMTNLGNVDGIQFTSNPPQWDEVHVCDSCRERKTVRVHGEHQSTPDLSGYKEL